MPAKPRIISRKPNWQKIVLITDLSDLIPTRQSLLSRLKDWNDQESWKVFFETYWKLIYKAAIKAGLNDAEAQDVVQETVISVFKSMPGFEYDAKKGSFKGWLLQLTRWRIADQLRKRLPIGEYLERNTRTSTKTKEFEGILDPVSHSLEALWDEEWENNLLEAAIERVKKKVDPKLYQAFDLYVFKKWPVLKVALTLKINPGKVYLTKHRMSNLIKKEINCIQTRPI